MVPGKIGNIVIPAISIVCLISGGFILQSKGHDTVTAAAATKGSVLTSESVNVSFEQVSGKVLSVPVKEEMHVKKGDVLMMLDPTDVNLKIEKVMKEVAQLDTQITQTNNSIQIGYEKVNTQEQQIQIDIAQTEVAERKTEIAKTRAEAAQRQAEAAQKQVEDGARKEDVQKQKLAVEAATKSYENAKTAYNRMKALYESGATTKANLDDAETSLTLAKNSVDQQKKSLQKMLAGATNEEKKQVREQTAQARAGVAQAQAEVDAAQISTEKAKTQLDQTAQTRKDLDNQKLNVELLKQQKENLQVQLKTLQVEKDRLILKAPQDGKITKVLAKSGENIAPGTPVITLETNDLYYDLYVNETIATTFKAGQKVVGHVNAINKDLTGQVRFVTSAPQFAAIRMSKEKGEADVATFQVRIYVTKTGSLLPGMTIEVNTDEISAR